MAGIMQYAFTGDVKKLKPAGWTFQKLYAANYKCYHQDSIFMYVKTQMVLEVTNVYPHHQAALIAFIIENADQPDEFWTRTKDMGKFGTMTNPAWYLTNHGRVVDGKTNSALFVDANSEFWDYCKDNTLHSDAAKTKEILDRKFAKEGGRDSFLIQPEFVKQVLALHALHPLELIESAWTQEMFQN